MALYEEVWNIMLNITVMILLAINEQIFQCPEFRIPFSLRLKYNKKERLKKRTLLFLEPFFVLKVTFYILK